MNCVSTSLAACLVLVVAAGWRQGATTEPKPLAGNPPPVYPSEARSDAVIGRVDVRASVGKDGKVTDVEVDEATPADYPLKEAAVKAVKSWRFEPALASGSPAPGAYKASFAFALKDPVLQSWFNVGASPIVTAGESVTLKKASGWARTARWFSDFELDCEFRILEPRSRAGLLVRARPATEDDRSSYRINLSDAVDGAEALGRIVSNRTRFREPRATEDAFNESQLASTVKPVGEWQTLKVLASNDEIRTAVNGVPVATVRVSERTGHLGFDAADGRVEVRNVRVQRRDRYVESLPASGGDVEYVNAPGQEKPPKGSVVPPKLLRSVKTDYSFEAMRRGSRGTIFVEAIVLKDGSVGPIHITKSLDLDLDQSAVAAIRQFSFAPATKDGQSIAYRLEFEMTFRLR